MNPKSYLLIIVDNESFLAVLEQTLKGEGYPVATAANGEEAVELAKNKQFQVILIDLVLPGKGGFEIIETLKDCLPEVRMIAMTGGLKGRSDSFLRMAEKMGACRTLAKPFSKEELLNAIEGRVAGPT
ncbi:response regulator [Luteolibacter arcticus]|uniref:Response regulator n=1 Tax=Luteolibacter arcticus TaxID=1581411 RepID=A0ABT3GDL1_9BACT|nr:response regulator [Luteolibacter arcticus]MCW1921715.1 response regulator [Luteolibacter arcticus]